MKELRPAGIEVIPKYNAWLMERRSKYKFSSLKFVLQRMNILKENNDDVEK